MEKNMAKLTITVSAEELEKAMQAAYLKARGKISLPGFRKGKAPRKMIEKMYGAGTFLSDAVNDLIPVEYNKAIEECDLELVSQPTIDIVEAEPGKDLVFTAEVAVKPEVTLGQYKGIEVPKTEIVVTDEEVEKELKAEQEKNSRTITVEDRAAAMGDIVTLDFEGFVDGEAFQGGKGTDYALTLGSKAFIPGFEEQLVGAENGAHVEVKVTFPEDYHSKDLAGKEAVFQCDIKKIEVKELPEAMLLTQARQIYDDFARRMQSQGLSMEQYFEFTGLTADKMIEDSKPQAMQRIQTRLVLEKVAEVENIQPTEEEVNKEIENMAAMYKLEADKLKEILGEREVEQIKKDMAVQKAVTLMAESAVEVEVKEEAAAEE